MGRRRGCWCIAKEPPEPTPLATRHYLRGDPTLPWHEESIDGSALLNNRIFIAALHVERSQGTATSSLSRGDPPEMHDFDVASYRHTLGLVYAFDLNAY